MEAREIIAAIIQHGGLTQRQIGERVGITQSHVSKILNGTVADVKSRHYRALQALYASAVVCEPAKAA